jgi:hypothetical protein
MRQEGLGRDYQTRGLVPHLPEVVLSRTPQRRSMSILLGKENREEVAMSE